MSIPFIQYQSIVDDWQAFQNTLLRPLPTCIWANTLRISPEHLADFLAGDGLEVEPVRWYPGAFKLPADFKPGYHWTFLAGLCHVQEEVALLPVLFLEPQPGERVLDLCAAPGNKTAQIAVTMKNQGTVIANDINGSRMRALRQAIERLGLLNVTTTNKDGANYPQAAGLFDKVLVDVPCSCQGTSRKDSAVPGRSGPYKKNGLQLALLRKAVQRCKPGGRIVYATCTYAPEENEAVVDTILQEFGPDMLQLMPAHVDGLITSPGLTEWQGRRYHPSLRWAMRIWPHQNNTGGFFIAVLEKLNSTLATNFKPDEPPAFEASVPPDEMIGLLRERFGFSANNFSPYLLFQRNGGTVYVVNQTHHPPTEPTPDAIGMALLKTRIRYPKLTTAGALRFGAKATKNYIELTPPQVRAYTCRQDVPVPAEQARRCTGPGYVLMRYKGFTLGVGVYYPHQTGGGGKVKSMFPKGWSPNKE